MICISSKESYSTSKISNASAKYSLATSELTSTKLPYKYISPSNSFTNGLFFFSATFRIKLKISFCFSVSTFTPNACFNKYFISFESI